MKTLAYIIIIFLILSQLFCISLLTIVYMDYWQILFIIIPQAINLINLLDIKKNVKKTEKLLMEMVSNFINSESKTSKSSKNSKTI